MDESAVDWMAEMLEKYRMHLRGEGGLSAEEIRKHPNASACIDELNQNLKWTKRFFTLQLGQHLGSGQPNTSDSTDIEDIIVGSRP